jgi:hypothetical protein
MAFYPGMSWQAVMEMPWGDFSCLVADMPSIQARQQQVMLEAVMPMVMKERDAKETIKRIDHQAKQGQRAYHDWLAHDPATIEERETALDMQLALLSQDPFIGGWIQVNRVE